MSKAKKILSDHKKVGKKFIPPMLQLQGGMKFVKWLDNVLPEILWIGMMQEKLGIKRSIEICCVIAKTMKNICQEQHSNFALISSYKKLNTTQYTALANELGENNLLSEISFSLKSLLMLYPSCPLNRVVSIEENNTSHGEALNEFKTILDRYFDRRVHSTNVMEATALCMCMLSGHVKYTNNVRPPDINALLTELPGSATYEKVASSVRATTLSLVSNVDEEWPCYFWGRGLLIDECKK